MNQTSNTTTAVAWAGLIAALIVGAVMIFGSSSSSSSQSSGPDTGSLVANHVENAPWLFLGGVQEGPQNLFPNTNTEDAIQIGPGQNQVAWKNTKSQTAYIDTGYVIIAGTSSTAISSSTINVYVGTSTKTTATDSFSLATAPFWSQFIDACKIATSSPAGLSRTSDAVYCDNMANHKSTYPSVIAVQPGQYLLMVAESWCTADGACNTATSSQRGWSTLTLPITYSF